MVEAAAADHQPAIATTDHGSLGASWKMAGLCAKRGIRYIPGVELYLAFGDRRGREVLTAPEGAEGGAGADAESKATGAKKYQHLTVLASSETGWRNLLAVSNAAHDPESFWSKPRADVDLLAEHAEGLIICTGCIGGPVAGRLVRGEPELAAANLAHLVEVFGPSNVFVEVMDHGIASERAILPELVGLARRFGLRVVATNDCHYTRPDEHVAHDALLCLADEGTTLSSPDRWSFDGTGYHLRITAEMRAIFDDQPGTEGACDTTLAIAEMVAERVIPEARMHLPRFALPEGVTAERRLFELVKAGAKARYGDPYPEAVASRLRHEYKVVTEKGLADYFLILADVIAWARSQGIRVGPGRGSAGGSVISYCLGIITIDPIRHGLLFERFLSPDRVGMPDIDTDFEQGRREEVFTYLTRRYGTERTAHIGTTTLQLTNAALRNAGRVCDDPGLGTRLAAKVPAGAGGKPVPFAVLDDGANPLGAEFRAAVAAEGANEGERGAVLDIARAFEGNVTAEGIHPCGFVICDEPLAGLVPLRRDRRKGHDGRGLVTEWDGTDCDAAGLLKLDVLGIRNLDVIAATEQIVAERTGEVVEAELASDDVDDPDPVARERARKAWQLVAEGRTAGVFQLESAGMTDLAQRIAPTSVDELSAIVALFRPGPLGAKTHDRYAARKAGREAIDYGIFTDDPAEAAIITGVLGDTYGLMIYQESMMRISQVVAGFDAYGRDRLRKAIGKKLAAEMLAVGEAFIAGATSAVDAEGRPKHVFKHSTAEALWRGMEGAAAYAFNKAHSVGYAKLAYETAWLKANWPAAYGAGLLSVTGAEDRRIPILRSLAAEGITVSTPDVNLGAVQTTLGTDGVVRLGLGEIKGIQSADAHAIVAEREANGPYGSLAEMLARVRVRGAVPTPTEPDEHSVDRDDPDGTDDDATDPDEDESVPGTQSPISLGSVRALIEAGACDAFGPRSGLLRAMRALRVAGVPVPDTEWGVVERAARERERLGASVSTNPLKELGAQFRLWRSPRADAKPTPLHRIEERCAPGGVVATVGVVASFEIHKKGRRRAHMILEGSTASLNCIVWSDQLQALERNGRVPQVGQVIGVDARVKKTTVAVPAGDGMSGETGDDDGAEHAPATMTKVELIVNDVWGGELEDEARRALVPVRVPMRV
jgi:DNA polymerase-3 subunit alpha